MALPANEDTSALRQAHVSKETSPGGGDHIIITAAATTNQGDLVKIGPYFGVADQDLAIGEKGTIHVGQRINVNATVTGAAQTFYTWGQDVFYDPADGKLYEATGAGRVKIGVVTEVASASDATFQIDCYRFWV